MLELELYFTSLLDGRINACDKMKKISEIILENLYNPNEFHFDPVIAGYHTDFIEKFCKLPSGKRNTPFKLELFQKARLQTIFGFVDDNDLRQYQEVLIIEGRKNGKTSETAAVELDMLVNDGEFSPQIYNLATRNKQAMLGFNACHKMIKQSPMLSKHIRKRAHDLYCDMNMGYIMALSSETSGLDGLDTHCATIDELAAIKNRDLYDLIKQSTSARRQGLVFTISTNGYVRDNIFDAQYEYASKLLNREVENKRFLPFIYELDSYDEFDVEEAWIKANPGLGTIKSLDYLRDQVQKAKDDIFYKPTVYVKEFNLKQTAASSWLRWEEIENKEKIPEDAVFRYCIGGMDAADSVDLNAAKAICMRPDDDKIYVKQMYWICSGKLEEYERQGLLRGPDSVPYRTWEAQGYLRIVDGHKVDKHVFLDWFKELRDEEDLYVMYIGYDKWHIDDSLKREFQDEFGKGSMIEVIQGMQTLSQKMKDLKADLSAKKIVYNDNPIDKWCMANTAVKTDINANIQPVKTDDPRKRIDGTMALLDAYVILQNKKDDYLAMI